MRTHLGHCSLCRCSIWLDKYDVQRYGNGRRHYHERYFKIVSVVEKPSHGHRGWHDALGSRYV